MARQSRHARIRTRTRHARGAGITPVSRILPWELLGQASQLLHERAHLMTPADSLRLRELVARSGGRGINLSLRERNELSLIVDRVGVAATRTVPAPLVASRRRISA
jgi:hypothetical protein